MTCSLIGPEEKRKLTKRIGRLVAKVMIGDLTKKGSKRDFRVEGGPMPLSIRIPT